MVVELEKTLKKFIENYKKKKRIREIESSLAEVLYQASALADFSSFEEMLHAIADASDGATSEEFREAHAETIKGKSFKRAVMAIAERNPSELVEKTLGVLVTAYETGADAAECLRETADEIAEISEITREQSAGLAIERYTLILAAGLIIPLVLGIISNVVSQIDVSLPADLTSVSSVDRTTFLQWSTYANYCYITLLGVMSGAFVAYQSNLPEKKFVYAAALALSALVVFTLVKFFA